LAAAWLEHSEGIATYVRDFLDKPDEKFLKAESSSFFLN
jgi:hypothetical protein